MHVPSRITVPTTLAAYHDEFDGEAGRAWIAALPDLAAEFLDRWRLRLDGPSSHGFVALVLPVLREDGTRAALKLQPVTDESVGEPVALRAWGGDGAVAMLDHDTASGTMLLERLDANRSLLAVEDHEASLRLLTELLARLLTTPAPAGLRSLADIAGAMLADTPDALPYVTDTADRRVVARCAEAVREVIAEPGDRLLHWDLHYENVLAPLPGAAREPWLAIDPKPLVGDPGFELLPALRDRWDDVTATGDVERAVLRRFDLMTDVLSLDRARAARWTLGRVLQNSLWEVEDTEDGEKVTLEPEQTAIARILEARL
ncbi:aminoglycoside phosphotransferase family protein [Streptomyces albireticuli]|uniref:Hydroxyurea phosphotransferase n=1 Tax=Streptomyces albireticuli TaxID=1940 RepID=A0A2A2D0U7_9ACTN|nr:aminoglycoside phosphotransferase family protein [Streptomyces albireticuli]MCD9143707.1 aminoglycoside phosphotransferase family protein [Streptomyces albireticuli]MCD9161862.1 aminoglycoside phosphotransferase family protein [Streptomyces albireticuli]MCD9191824.1 aminoglycoside phosphotransferase family protein [Streptomyces albireticuli]PAU45134.1 hydroxyurea phosphotransferase [Streptomyces albireticuli]